MKYKVFDTEQRYEFTQELFKDKLKTLRTAMDHWDNKQHWSINFLMPLLSIQERELVADLKDNLSPQEVEILFISYYLTKNQKSFLIYLESRSVNYAGRIDYSQINEEDVEDLEKFVKLGWAETGRINSRYHTENGSDWIELSIFGYDLAHRARKERAFRIIANRCYTRTNEK